MHIGCSIELKNCLEYIFSKNPIRSINISYLPQSAASHTCQKNEKIKSVSFFSHESVEMISNIKGARTPSKKWKYSTTKAEKEKKGIKKSR